jgi:hypothetical protein
MDEPFSLKIYRQPQTVFTFKELGILFPAIKSASLKNRVAYALKNKTLTSPRRGIYVKTDFDFLELANKIYTPSYISLETVLAAEGVVFQWYETVFAISYLTRRINAGGREIFYRKIKDKILLNQDGVIRKGNYFIASKERAFLDAVFLYRNYHFDNLEALDWKLIEQLKYIYQSRALIKRVSEYAKDYVSKR